MRITVARIDGTTAKARAAVQRAFEYQGIFARVARQLGLGPNGRSHVYRVATGERKSPRVMQALLAEIERIERKKAA